MMVKIIVVSAFIERKILSELMLEYQVTINQELHGIVQSSPADPEISFSHSLIQRIHVKMPLFGIYQFQYRISFRRFPVFIGREIFGKYLLYSDEYIFDIFMLVFIHTDYAPAGKISK
jgi:hypothetical protein